MIRVLLLLLCLVATSAYPTWFLKYMKEHNKKYTPLGRRIAYQVLKPKYEHIKTSNNGLVLELQSHSDKRKRRRLHHVSRSTRSNFTGSPRLNLGMPLRFDWRTHNMVGPVRNQGTCGGCYCFSALDNLQYLYKKKTGTMPMLSVQQCLDCSREQVKLAEGCNGGLMEDVWNLRSLIGEEKNDKFKMHDESCHIHQSHGIRATQHKTLSSEWGDSIEKHLAQNLIRYGPQPVGVDSSSMNFDLYKRGIITAKHCGTNIDHAVTVVGFDSQNGIRYWIVKNSWGKKWGQDGYFYLQRDANSCGLDTGYSSFATDAEVVL